MDEKTQKRFWSKVDRREEHECWEWTAYRDLDGYGGFLVGGRRQRAHRIAMVLCGYDVSGWQVLHSCDNRGCVNPAHLRLGTPADNMRDQVERGRRKLAMSDAEEIRRLVGEGESRRSVAKRFGVSISLVGGIVCGERWVATRPDASGNLNSQTREPKTQ